MNLFGFPPERMTHAESLVWRDALTVRLSAGELSRVVVTPDADLWGWLWAQHESRPKQSVVYQGGESRALRRRAAERRRGSGT